MDYRMDKTVYAADQNKRFVMSDFTRFVRSMKRNFFTVCINDSNIRAFFLVLLLFQIPISLL